MVMRMSEEVSKHIDAQAYMSYMTSGGTESIIVAVKTYRDRARDLFGITEPEMVLPITAHAAFEKASHMLHVKSVYIPLDKDYKPDVAAMRRAITRKTILLVASAPAYPHGIVDPIEQIADLALVCTALCLTHLDRNTNCLCMWILVLVASFSLGRRNWVMLSPNLTSLWQE